jgi:phage-related holin
MPKQILNILNAHDNVDFFMKFVLWFLAILVPLYDVAGALSVLIIIDLITGIIASIKQSVRFQWSKIINTFTKLIIYSLILLAAWVIESKIIPSIPFMRLVAGFLALTELRSILENFKDIFGIDAWNYIRAAIKRQNVQEISNKN